VEQAERIMPVEFKADDSGATSHLREYTQINMRKNGVKTAFSVTVERITEDGITAKNADGDQIAFPADTVILSAGMVPAAGEAEAFRAGDWDFFAVGDCVRARNVRNATRTGYDAAMQI